MSRTMTVGDLKAMLGDYDDELEVRIAIQPGWPLIHAVAGIVGPDDVPHSATEPYPASAHAARCRLPQDPCDTPNCDCACHEQPDEEEDVPIDSKLYLLAEEGHPYNENPYGTKAWWDYARAYA